MLADQWLPEATGTEFLARVRQLHPAARRVLLITWGDQASSEPILRATVLGDIDAYVVKPGTPPDEHFHRFVTEQLDERGRSNLPGLEVVRVVGEEWAARSHELRELLGRNGIPFGFYPADGPEGQRLFEEAGAALTVGAVLLNCRDACPMASGHSDHARQAGRIMPGKPVVTPELVVLWAAHSPSARLLVVTESALFYVSLFVGDGLLMTLCHPGQGLPRRDWRGLRRS